MRKQFLTVLIIILGLQGYSQTAFKKGYIINNSSKKIECLIKDLDWRNNPTKFEYKLNEDANVKIGTLATVKEFVIAEETKYVRFKGDIDRSISTDNINMMKYDKDPIFREEKLFLKVLLEGKSNLYQYHSESLTRYFYKTENGDIEQLIYKKYKVEEHKIAENTRYKEQLWRDLKCSDISIKTFNSLDYKKNDLINFFIAYNECYNSEFIRYRKKRKEGLFNINIRPGMNNSSLHIHNSLVSRSANFGKKISFRMGVELEYVLPFNNNKWAILFEPTYRSYESEVEFNYFQTITNPINFKVDYTSIEFPVGVRYYSFISDNSKLFFNGSYALEYVISDSVKSSGGSQSPVLDIKTSGNLSFGAGYTFKNKFSAEFRFSIPREVLGNYVFWSSDFKNVSLILGYTIFSNKKNRG